MTTEQYDAPAAPTRESSTGKTLAIIAAIVGAVVVVVSIVLTLEYRSQEQSVVRQLQQLQLDQQQAARTAQQANGARLGVCWSSTQDGNTFDVQSISLSSPVLSNGVYQCPSGENFVSVVPAQG